MFIKLFPKRSTEKVKTEPPMTILNKFKMVLGGQLCNMLSYHQMLLHLTDWAFKLSVSVFFKVKVECQDYKLTSFTSYIDSMYLVSWTHDLLKRQKQGFQVKRRKCPKVTHQIHYKMLDLNQKQWSGCQMAILDAKHRLIRTSSHFLIPVNCLIFWCDCLYLQTQGSSLA